MSPHRPRTRHQPVFFILNLSLLMIAGVVGYGTLSSASANAQVGEESYVNFPIENLYRSYRCGCVVTSLDFPPKPDSSLFHHPVSNLTIILRGEHAYIHRKTSVWGPCLQGVIPPFELSAQDLIGISQNREELRAQLDQTTPDFTLWKYFPDAKVRDLAIVEDLVALYPETHHLIQPVNEREAELISTTFFETL